MKWIWTACVICSLISLFNYATIGPGFVAVGYALPSSPHWFYAVLPLLVAAAIFLHQRGMENRLAPIPAERRSNAHRDAAGKMHPKQSIYRTPTYWVMAVLAAVVLTGVVFVAVMSAQDKAENLDLRTRVWPAERAATLQQLKARQLASESTNPIMIDLKPRLNASLLESIDGTANVKDNNLVELPSGIHTFGGVVFSVEGRIQLLGRNLIKSGKRFPVIVKNIPISRQCARIHLLHGASAVRTLDEKIARLVLHYKDGSQTEIAVMAGQDVLDWWGPIYNTDGGDERNTTSPGTELAWAGSNPWIKKRAPEYSLRLYRSTFANPRPDLEISSIDYVSTLSEAAPFLLGLTID